MFTAFRNTNGTFGPSLGPMTLIGALATARNQTRLERGEITRLIGSLERREAIDLPRAEAGTVLRIERIGGGGPAVIFELIEAGQIQARNPDRPEAITCAPTVTEARTMLQDAERLLDAAATARRQMFVAEHGTGEGDW